MKEIFKSVYERNIFKCIPAFKLCKVMQFNKIFVQKKPII